MNPIVKEPSLLSLKKAEVIELLKQKLDEPGVRDWCYQATMNQHMAFGHVDAPLTVLSQLFGEAMAVEVLQQKIFGLPHRVIWVRGDEWPTISKAAVALGSVVGFAYHGGFQSIDYARAFFSLDELDLAEFEGQPNILVEDFRLSEKSFFNARFGLWLRDRALRSRVTFLSVRPGFDFSRIQKELGDCYQDIPDKLVASLIV